MLGHSVSYFLSQYWRNVPLYAEKLIPLLDNCLSNNFIFSDKVAGAFYELTNKYQNTAELPLENLKEFIREQGYGYILDLMIQDEENIKLLWYLLVLIHQLKGSKEGLELVLSMFQEYYDPEKINQLETLGEPTITSLGGFVSGKGPTLLFNKLNVTGACLNGSRAIINYSPTSGEYPETYLIGEAGTYTLSFINSSFETLGKLNSIKVTANHLNTDKTVLFERKNIPYNYPQKRISGQFTFAEGESPIREIIIEIECDFYGKLGACINDFKITKDGTTYVPKEGWELETEASFFDGYEVEKMFLPFDINNTSITGKGEIEIVYPNSLSSGNYVLDFSLLGGNDLRNYINDLNISIRYDDYDPNGLNQDVNTLGVYSGEDLPYFYVRENNSIEFRAIKPFNQIYITYNQADSEVSSSSTKLIMSDLGIYKKSAEVVIKTIPNMTSKATPSGSVVTNTEFVKGYDAYKVFNYTSPTGATPTRDGYVKYDYEINERPTTGEYVFTWANSSTDNNAYISSLDAFITYIDGTQLQVCAEPELEPVLGKTKYFYKFTATNTIKSLTINFKCQYNNGVGGTFSEANITRTKEIEGGSSIDVWYEPLPVARENTFSIDTEVDIAQTGSEFFDNFKNFVRNYVYPELETLKVKYSLEGVQTQRVYSVSKIKYESTCIDNSE